MSPSPDSSAPLPDIREIAGPDSLLSVWEIVGLIGVLVLLLGLLVAGGWIFFHYHRKSKRIPRTPKSIARERLKVLSQQIDDLSPNEFALEASEALKDYLAARFGDPVRFETSEEFLARLSTARSAIKLPPELRDRVATFLSSSDEIKYGRIPDAARHKQALWQQALEVIETEPPPPEPPSSSKRPGSGRPSPKSKKAPARPRKRRKIVS